MKSIVLEIKNISKKFKGVQALEDVSIDIARGEVHAIIGENGAGKSTLIKIISGVLKPNSGNIIFDGNDVTFMPPTKLFVKGISSSYQENSLFENLTVAQNLFIGKLYRHMGFTFDWEELLKEAQSLLNLFDLTEISPLDIVINLAPENRQILEILKALQRQPKILCLDEPTAALTETRVERLFNLIKDFKERGVTFIYVSHNLKEVLKISDRITVLRDGRKVDTIENKNVDEKNLHELMIGRPVVARLKKRIHVESKNPILVANDIGDGKKLKNISFKIYPGEILGFAGLVGSGRTELAWLVFGLSKLESGYIIYNGQKYTQMTPSIAISKGIMYLPEDRKVMGLFLDQDLRLNVSAAALNKISNGIFINSEREKTQVIDMLRRIRVKYSSLSQTVVRLSGGNQQKVLFGKCLFTDPKLLILDEPTKGIDVGSKEEIYEIIRDLVERGVAIMLISSEVEEICRLCDRVVVMIEGQIEGIYKGDDINEKYITI
ncbi:MAG: sugar ABC transporter ATP-binding protein, partial [Actinobacteria bacterium]|nr:sugar ABC transporter ATP-binding protein [Actinomycetota bacterium]